MVTPVILDFKNYFTRDFPYGGTAGDLTLIQDSDIQRALDEAADLFNPDLFEDQPSFTRAYLHLAAHCLVMNLRNSTQGLSGAGQWLVSSKGVGSVSLGFTIPDEISQNPVLAQLSTTQYGVKYLGMVLGKATGAMGIACGRTLPG